MRAAADEAHLRTRPSGAHGHDIKSHVEREVLPGEAAVVRCIFEWFASGLGLKAIAKRLTSEQAIKPTPMARRDGLVDVRAHLDPNV